MIPSLNLGRRRRTIMGIEVSKEQVLGGSRFVGLSHNEILQSLDVQERRIVGNSTCGDFDSIDHRIRTLAQVAVDRFGDKPTNEVE